jgi:hypothetical protein
MILNISVVNLSTVHNNRNYSTKYYVHTHDLSRLKDKLCITATHGTDWLGGSQWAEQWQAHLLMLTGCTHGGMKCI